MAEDKFEISNRYWHDEPQHFSNAYKFSVNPVRLAAKFFLDQRTAQVKRALDLNPSVTVADIGCGSGETIDWVAERSKFVTGIDVSEAMIAIARSKVKAPNVELIVSNCDPIPLADNSQDRVMVLGVLDYVLDPAGYCRELGRIVKPGGLLIVTAPKSPSLFQFLRWSTSFRKTVSSMPPIVSSLDRAAMEQAIRGAGLQMQDLSSIWTTMWVAVARKPA